MRCGGGDRKSWQVTGLPFWEEQLVGPGNARHFGPSLSLSLALFSNYPALKSSEENLVVVSTSFYDSTPNGMAQLENPISAHSSKH